MLWLMSVFRHSINLEFLECVTSWICNAARMIDLMIPVVSKTCLRPSSSQTMSLKICLIFHVSLSCLAWVRTSVSAWLSSLFWQSLNRFPTLTMPARCLFVKPWLDYLLARLPAIFVHKRQVYCRRVLMDCLTARFLLWIFSKTDWEKAILRSSCLVVRPSVRPYRITRLLEDEFSRNF